METTGERGGARACCGSGWRCGDLEAAGSCCERPPARDPEVKKKKPRPPVCTWHWQRKMGQQPSTGTACAFPYVTPASSTAQPCSQTYAQFVGAPFYLLLAVELFVSLDLITVMTVRLLRLRQFDPKRRFMHHWRLFVASLTLGVLVILNAINLFGFLIPALPWGFYMVTSELVACSCGMISLFIVDYWNMLSNPIIGSKEFSFRVLAAMATYLLVIFVGLEVVAFSYPQDRPLLYAFQYMGCAFFVAFVVFQASRSVMAVYSALGMVSGNDSSRLVARKLIRKFAMFIVLLMFAFVLMVYASSSYFATHGSLASTAADLEVLPKIGPFYSGFQAVFIVTECFSMVMFVLPASFYDGPRGPSPAASSFEALPLRVAPDDSAGFSLLQISMKGLSE